MALTTRKSVCALDCPDTCALVVHIDEAGQAAKLTGDPGHPVTRGFLCGKVAQYLEREYHPDRLLYPLRRTGPKGAGQFKRVTWDQALDEIAARLQTISDVSSPEAILPYSYAGTMGLLNGAGMDRRFFHRLGASRLDRTICSATGGEAIMRTQGIKLGTDPEQFPQAKLIIAWGANVLGTNAHLWPFIVEARRNGARFYVIDPVKNRTGKAADRHFAVHPGSDQALALGLIHVILRESLQDQTYIDQHSSGFEQLSAVAKKYTPEKVSHLSGISAVDIEGLAREYATTRPAVIRLNNGVQRSERGGAAVCAIAALPVITGSWREAGGGLQLSTSGAFEFNRKDLERADLQQLSPLKRQGRVVNMVQLGQALTELDRPRVEALVVYNSNPAAIAPNQAKVVAGFLRDDLFTVVLEQFMTDTARHADFILPVTTFLEHTDLYLAYGHYYLQMARPALPAPGETRCNVEIFRALAKRMGFDDPCFDDSEDDMIRTLLDSDSKYLKGITLQDLDREGSIRLNATKGGGDRPFLPFANGGFKTASRKFDFGAASLDYQPPEESRHGSADLSALYPLEFVSPKNDDSMNSTFGHRERVDRQTAFLAIHPGDAMARGLKSGDPVRVFNGRGCCFLIARISDEVQPGVTMSRSTRWNTHALRSLGVNRLTSDRLTDMGGGAIFYSCLVEVAAAQAENSVRAGMENDEAPAP